MFDASALGRVEIVKFLLENNAVTDSTGKNAKKIAKVLKLKKFLWKILQNKSNLILAFSEN
jgi:selenophosphate synthase